MDQHSQTLTETKAEVSKLGTNINGRVDELQKLVREAAYSSGFKNGAASVQKPPTAT